MKKKKQFSCANAADFISRYIRFIVTERENKSCQRPVAGHQGQDEGAGGAATRLDTR